MPTKAYWAYDFACGRSMEALLAVLNKQGPWPWELRESGYYGDYLNTRPLVGVRMRIHQYPQGGEAGTTFVGRRDRGFSALLQVDSESTASREEIDVVFRALLASVDAAEVTEIEPYD